MEFPYLICMVVLVAVGALQNFRMKQYFDFDVSQLENVAKALHQENALGKEETTVPPPKPTRRCAWRATIPASCSWEGERLTDADQEGCVGSASELVDDRAPGYCDCGNGILLGQSSCDSKGGAGFKCVDVCFSRRPSEFCYWRATQDGSVRSRRIEGDDLRCRDPIPLRAHGYCQCAAGNKLLRGRGMDPCLHTCHDLCVASYFP